VKDPNFIIIRLSSQRRDIDIIRFFEKKKRRAVDFSALFF